MGASFDCCDLLLDNPFFACSNRQFLFEDGVLFDAFDGVGCGTFSARDWRCVSSVCCSQNVGGKVDGAGSVRQAERFGHHVVGADGFWVNVSELGGTKLFGWVECAF